MLLWIHEDAIYWGFHGDGFCLLLAVLLIFIADIILTLLQIP